MDVAATKRPALEATAEEHMQILLDLVFSNT